MAVIHNPVLRGFNPDPCICRVGDDYYIATSTFEWFPGVQVHHSRDLRHWRLLTRPLDRTSQIDLRGNPDSGGVWAPALSYHDGRFYLVFTDVKTWHLTDPFKDTHNYLVTAPDILGPWSEPVYLNSSGFDPSLFHDEDGRCWLLNMVWDHRKGRNPFPGIVLHEYSSEAQALIGEPRWIFRGSPLGVTEGPHLYRKDGWYYLVTAEGGTGFEHAVTVARGRDIFGPYEVSARSPLLTSAGSPDLALQKAGHGSVVQTQRGDWYLAHLCSRPLSRLGRCNLGRETALQKLHWPRDEWPALASGGNAPTVDVSAPALPAYPFPPEEEVDHFDGRLGIHLQTLRVPADPTWMSLHARKGFLRLWGRESLTSRHDQSLIARRLQAQHAEFETCLEFEPETFQQMAGLAAYYDTRNWVYLRLSRDERYDKALNILSFDNGRYDEALTADVPIGAAASIYMRLIFDGELFRFEYALKAGQWRAIGPEFEAGRLSDDYCQSLAFTGTFGALCCQDLSGGRLHADFDYLAYRER